MRPLGRKTKWAVWCAAGCLLTAAAVYLAWPVAVLKLTDPAAPDRPVLAVVLKGNDTVGIGFTHSFYKVPQEERYVVQGDRLRLATVFFGSHDALDYYDPLSVYPRRKVPGGYEVAMRPPTEFPINFAMGHQTDIWLRLGSKRKIYLNKLMPKGDGFDIRVVYRPRLIAEMTERLHGF
ncbi:MAG: DUF1850 domain-containing protein [Proteobacteria bacterium]|nr:DUF1850 domain-containing protein [Pseudomonadota bacterium]MBU4385107.1 DUF1850 domain-containing protein [Pseudomonadota bacterium]MBU4605667.1 DUF1850 domain-containing protein [Pseudomonadota bacterium]MCG2764714.1 DUF1850 domain-containing protein [Desulfarculaceae bacterium]